MPEKRRDYPSSTRMRWRPTSTTFVIPFATILRFLKETSQLFQETKLSKVYLVKLYPFNVFRQDFQRVTHIELVTPIGRGYILRAVTLIGIVDLWRDTSIPHFPLQGMTERVEAFGGISNQKTIEETSEPLREVMSHITSYFLAVKERREEITPTLCLQALDVFSEPKLQQF